MRCIHCSCFSRRPSRITTASSTNPIATSSSLQTYVVGTVTVSVDSRTQLDDDDDDGTLALTDIRSGDFLEVEANLVGDTLFASRLRRREEDDDDILQAWVEILCRKALGIWSSVPVRLILIMMVR